MKSSDFLAQVPQIHQSLEHACTTYYKSLNYTKWSPKYSFSLRFRCTLHSLTDTFISSMEACEWRHDWPVLFHARAREQRVRYREGLASVLAIVVSSVLLWILVRVLGVQLAVGVHHSLSHQAWDARVLHVIWLYLGGNIVEQLVRGHACLLHQLAREHVLAGQRGVVVKSHVLLLPLDVTTVLALVVVRSVAWLVWHAAADRWQFWHGLVEPCCRTTTTSTMMDHILLPTLADRGDWMLTEETGSELIISVEHVVARLLQWWLY